MEKEIVIPDMTEKTLSVEDIEKFITELTEKSGNEKGEWIYTQEAGFVWKPDDLCAEMPPTPAPSFPDESTPPPALVELVRWGNSIDFDNLAKNSVVLIKINTNDPHYAQYMQHAIARQVLHPRAEKLKANATCVLFMQAGDDINVMTEEEMSQAGWEKKEKSLIILPR
jgi:hypothetical protein